LSGDGEERSAEEALGGVALRTRKQVIEGEVSVVMVGGCSSCFYSGRGGHTGAGKGGTASGNGLNAIDGVAA
jgi:Fe-S cluster biogenesis protein NfuA